MRDKKFNVARDVYIPKVDSKWPSKTKKKKKAIFSKFYMSDATFQRYFK